MSRAVARYIAGLLVLFGMLVSSQAAQSVTAEVSGDSVPLGSVFELRVDVRVPSGSTVYFPDTIPGTDVVESHGPVRWKAEPVSGGAMLRLTYPLIAFGLRDVRIPGFDVLVGPATRGESLPGGSFVGAWGQAREAGHASGVLATVDSRFVRVASVFQLEAVLAGVGPMPARDVLGASWNTSSLVLAFVSSCVLIASLVAMLRKRLRSRALRARASPAVAPALGDAKHEALNELDSLLARGLHTAGRTLEFYTMSTGIVRRYAERLDARWRTALTSTELMLELQTHGGSIPVGELSGEMNRAEVVKFGQLRPEAEVAEAHWRAVREWIEKTASGTRER